MVRKTHAGLTVDYPEEKFKVTTAGGNLEKAKRKLPKGS